MRRRARRVLHVMIGAAVAAVAVAVAAVLLLVSYHILTEALP